MKRKIVIRLLATVFLAIVSSADAQHAEKMARATDEVRVGHQSKNCEGDRIDDSDECFSQSRSGNPMIEQSKSQN